MIDKAPSPAARWDRSRQTEMSSTLVVARPQADAVTLDFGERVDGEGAEVGGRWRRRIAMRPAAAKRLHEMLVRLTAETGASAQQRS